MVILLLDVHTILAIDLEDRQEEDKVDHGDS